MFPTSIYIKSGSGSGLHSVIKSDHDRQHKVSVHISWVRLGMTKRESVSFGGMLCFRDVICFRFS